MLHRPGLACLLVGALSAAGAAHAVDYLSVPEAAHALFPGADAFVPHPLELSADDRNAIRRRAGTRQREDVQRTWRAMKDGTPLGWMMLDDVIGKHEYITYAIAVSPEGKVLNLEILSYRETHGGEIRRESWRSQFVGKSGQDRLRLGRDVDNISGATLSCRNVTDGVRRLLVLWDLKLKDAR